MALSKEAIEQSRICPDWCPEEFFDHAGEPEHLVPDNPTNPTSNAFIDTAVLFYQKSFNTLFSALDSDIVEKKQLAQNAFDNALAEQEPGGRVIYEKMR